MNCTACSTTSNGNQFRSESDDKQTKATKRDKSKKREREKKIERLNAKSNEENEKVLRTYTPLNLELKIFNCRRKKSETVTT